MPSPCSRRPARAGLAAALHETACSGGVAQGCRALGTLLRAGRGTRKDERQAARQLVLASLIEKSCPDGDMGNCPLLGGRSEEEGEATMNPSRADAYAKACKSGVAQACVYLGLAHDLDEGVVPQDRARAAALYTQACDAGLDVGCELLGIHYLVGMGVPRDQARAAALYERACTGGRAPSCKLLGTSYLRGTGVRKDARHAAALFKQACDSGEAKGCQSLGELYEKGRGVRKDVRRAAQLYEQACEGGVVDSCRTQAPQNERRTSELEE